MTIQYKRVFILVLDSLGMGAMPDAHEFGDCREAHTFLHVALGAGGLHIPMLESLGIGHLAKAPGVNVIAEPRGSFGIMAEASRAKDTTIGHWEMMGIISEVAFPTYPNGFPPEIISAFEEAAGRKIIGNKPASGTEIIKELGEEHINTGKPIVYTSGDSVFQIACHEKIIHLNELYDMCLKARKLLKEPHNVSRVIARPFIGTPGNFNRTENRRDFSLPPPKRTLLDEAVKAGIKVIGVGKIEDIFAGHGISLAFHAGNNRDGMKHSIELAKTEPGPCIIFTNLVDFDMLYGHRNDVLGYANALIEFDKDLAIFLPLLTNDDLLLITADHGCDPADNSTDHSREYVPILTYSPKISCGRNLGVRKTFADLGATVAEALDIPYTLSGSSFLKECCGSLVK